MATFPLPILPTTPWRDEKGSKNTHFGAGRSAINPKTQQPYPTHGACDLVVPMNTPVRAIADGTVWYFSLFYESVAKNKKGEETCHIALNELVIIHDAFIVRYGEVSPKLPAGVGKPGTRVQEGQTIAYVGNNCSNNPMLHLEMFSDVARRDSLTDRNPKTKYKNVPQRTYQRRDDLLDPTPFLDRWAMGLLMDRWKQRKDNVVNALGRARDAVQQGVNKLIHP